MITFTASEMREMTGIDAKNLWNYWNRGQLEKNEKKEYPFNKINKLFLAEKGIQSKVEKIVSEKKKKPASKPKESKPKKTVLEAKKETQKKELKPKSKPAPKKTKAQTQSEELSAIQSVNVRQKEIAIENAEIVKAINQKKLEEMEGNLIDLNETVLIFKNYSENFNKELLQTIRTFIQDLCARHDIDSGKMGEYKIKVADIINAANDKSVNNLLKKFVK